MGKGFRGPGRPVEVVPEDAWRRCAEFVRADLDRLRAKRVGRPNMRDALKKAYPQANTDAELVDRFFERPIGRDRCLRVLKKLNSLRSGARGPSLIDPDIAKEMDELSISERSASLSRKSVFLAAYVHPLARMQLAEFIIAWLLDRKVIRAGPATRKRLIAETFVALRNAAGSEMSIEALQHALDVVAPVARRDDVFDFHGNLIAKKGDRLRMIYETDAKPRPRAASVAGRDPRRGAR